MGKGEGQLACVGLIGLGAMGAAYADRMIGAGSTVIGYDVAGDAVAGHAAAGGVAASSVREVAEACDVIVTALPSFNAFEAVVADLCSVPRRSPGWIVDTNTLSATTKRRAWLAFENAGWDMLDCTVSGSPEMVRNDSYSFYISGDGRDHPRVRGVIAQLAGRVFDVGAFGNASTIKAVINHLVSVHNVATAEAMSLGIKAGIDRRMVYDMVMSSAGASRIFEARGAMMMADSYPAASTYALLVDKDMVVIGDLAREVRHPVPMFAAATQVHVAGLAAGWGGTDPASLCAWFEGRPAPGLGGQHPTLGEAV